jgi:hypothetical protein
MRLTQSAAVAAAAVAVVGVVAAAASAAGGDPADVSNPASNMHIANKLDGGVSAASELEKVSKAELIARLRELEGRAPPPAQQEQLWPELMKTPFMMWNGWLHHQRPHPRDGQ